MNALIVSLNFNPGHFSHLIANYKLFEELGYKPYLYVNSSFKKMDQEDVYDKVYSIKNIDNNDTKVAVFWFPSLKNIWEMIKLKFFFKSKIIYVYHEPFDSIVNYFRSGFGFIKILKICLINLVNFPILLLSNNIILPSVSSLSLYEKKYKWINKNYTMIPLIFDDENKGVIKIEDKKYISYIGTIAADHAFNEFIDLARVAMQNDWFPEHKFLIATSSVIPLEKKEQIKKFIEEGKIFISEGSFMSNETINNFYKNSVVVWNAYNRSMQSGVLPKAYMFGAAVIVLTSNSSKFIDDNETGILINDNKDDLEFKKAIETILFNKSFFQEKCRNRFLSTFFYKIYIDDFKKILK